MYWISLSEIQKGHVCQQRRTLWSLKRIVGYWIFICTYCWFKYMVFQKGIAKLEEVIEDITEDITENKIWIQTPFVFASKSIFCHPSYSIQELHLIFLSFIQYPRFTAICYYRSNCYFNILIFSSPRYIFHCSLNNRGLSFFQLFCLYLLLGSLFPLLLLLNIGTCSSVLYFDH